MFSSAEALSTISILPHVENACILAIDYIERKNARPDPSDQRTKAEQLDDAVFGFALELAVIEQLESDVVENACILPATSWTHDLILRFNGKELPVDVKSVKRNARALTVNQNETRGAPSDTIYLVFELDRSTGAASILGFAQHFELCPTKFGNGTSYVMLGNLNDLSSLSSLF